MEEVHPRYEAIPGFKRLEFYLSSDDLEADIAWITANNVESIRIVKEFYKIKTIEPLFKIKNLKSLYLFLDKTDLSELYKLTDLEELGIAELNDNINLSDLHRLKSLYLLNQRNITGLASLKALEFLIIIKADQTILTESLFKNYSNLDDFTLLSPRVPSNVSFLKQNKKLRALEIFNSRSNFDVSDLEFLKNSLKELRIDTCKNVKNLEETIPKLKNLEKLSIINSVPLKNSKFVDALEKLDLLAVTERSFFEDGDLSNLMGRLTYLGMTSKKHYMPKVEDILTKNPPGIKNS